MSDEVENIYWIKDARIALEKILEYRYKNIPTAKRIVRLDIIRVTESIKFLKQYQRDADNLSYRCIFIRDYKILYSIRQQDIYIINVICVKADKQQNPI